MTIVRSFSRIGFFNRLIFSSSSFFFRINRWIKISSTRWMKRSSSGHRSLPFLVSQVDKFKMKFLARSCESLPPRSTSPRNNREIHLAKSFHAMYIYIRIGLKIVSKIRDGYGKLFVPRTGCCFESNATRKEDGKSHSTNEKHALKSVAQSSRKRWDCNRFQTMENTLTRFQFAKSLSRRAKKYFSRIFSLSLPLRIHAFFLLLDHHSRLYLSLRNFLLTHFLVTPAETRIFIIDKIKIPSTMVNTSPSRLSFDTGLSATVKIYISVHVSQVSSIFSP